MKYIATIIACLLLICTPLHAGVDPREGLSVVQDVLMLVEATREVEAMQSQMAPDEQLCSRYVAMTCALQPELVYVEPACAIYMLEGLCPQICFGCDDSDYYCSLGSRWTRLSDGRWAKLIRNVDGDPIAFRVPCAGVEDREACPSRLPPALPGESGGGRLSRWCDSNRICWCPRPEDEGNGGVEPLSEPLLYRVGPRRY